MRKAFASALVVGLIAASAIGAQHVHADSAPEADSCAACRVVHAPALGPAPAVVVAVVQFVEVISATPVSYVPVLRFECASPRGPPFPIA